MTSLLSLYVSAFNSSLPAMILIVLGAFATLTDVFPFKNYGNLTSLAFKVALPVKTIYTLSTQPLSSDDIVIIVGIVVTSAVTALLIVPVVFLYPRRQRGVAFSALLMILLQNNMIISGIPVFSGLYDPELVPKYAYLQILACFGFVLPFIFFSFEFFTTASSGSVCRLIGACLWRTVKQPVIIGVLLGLAGNAVFTPLHLKMPQFLTLMFSLAGNVVAPLGLFMLGMFVVKKHSQRSTKTLQLEKTQPEALSKGKNAFMIFYIQVMRHLVMPVMLAVCCRVFGATDELIVELSVGIFASPTAVLSVVVCEQYGFGAEAAGLDAVLGFVTGFAVIPVLQTVCRHLYA